METSKEEELHDLSEKKHESRKRTLLEQQRAREFARTASQRARDVASKQVSFLARNDSTTQVFKIGPFHPCP